MFICGGWTTCGFRVLTQFRCERRQIQVAVLVLMVVVSCGEKKIPEFISTCQVQVTRRKSDVSSDRSFALMLKGQFDQTNPVKNIFSLLTLMVYRHNNSVTCDPTGRLEERSMITLLPVGSHSGIDTFCLPWRRHAGGATANVSCPETLFLVHNGHV